MERTKADGITSVTSRINLTLLLGFFIIVGGGSFVCAQNLFRDPNIPDGETITYVSYVGDERTTIVERTLQKDVGEKRLYEITSRSDSMEKTTVLERDTMAVVSAHAIIMYEDVTLDSKITLLDANSYLRKDVCRADISSLRYFFRGFPFGGTEKVKLQFYGEKSKRKSTIIGEYKKREILKVDQDRIECYKFEFGIEGFWQKFFPKTALWYSVAPPHYLVRYEGPSGPPGAPKHIIELVSYDVTETSRE